MFFDRWTGKILLVVLQKDLDNSWPFIVHVHFKTTSLSSFGNLFFFFFWKPNKLYLKLGMTEILTMLAFLIQAHGYVSIC